MILAVLLVLSQSPDPAQIAALGRRLFFDTRLSRDNSIACATCHDPAKAFTDGRAVAQGIAGSAGARNTPTLVNRGGAKVHFWDGRAATLEQQALMPLQDASEMAMDVPQLLNRLRVDSSYDLQFRTVFQREVNTHDLAWTLAEYVRTIRAGNAPIDRYLHGDDAALSAEEREGFRLFRDKANCSACHAGTDFTDESFHNTGVAWREGRIADEGRFTVSGRSYHHGAFKTPTLREIGRTAPYMHDGSIATLEEVVEYYDRGGNPNPYLDEQIKPLHLTRAEKRAIVAFLKKLDGTIEEGTPVSREMERARPYR